MKSQKGNDYGLVSCKRCRMWMKANDLPCPSCGCMEAGKVLMDFAKISIWFQLAQGNSNLEHHQRVEFSN